MREDKGRNSSNVAASQGAPRIGSHRQKLGRGKEGFYPECQWKRDPADIQPRSAFISFSEHLELRTFS